MQGLVFLFLFIESIIACTLLIPKTWYIDEIRLMQNNMESVILAKEHPNRNKIKCFEYKIKQKKRKKLKNCEHQTVPFYGGDIDSTGTNVLYIISVNNTSSILIIQRNNIVFNVTAPVNTTSQFTSHTSFTLTTQLKTVIIINNYNFDEMPDVVVLKFDSLDSNNYTQNIISKVDGNAYYLFDYEYANPVLIESLNVISFQALCCFCIDTILTRFSIDDDKFELNKIGNDIRVDLRNNIGYSREYYANTFYTYDLSQPGYNIIPMEYSSSYMYSINSVFVFIFIYIVLGI